MRHDQLLRARRTLAAIDGQQQHQIREGLGWFLRAATYAKEHVDRSTPSGARWFASQGYPRADVKHLIGVVRLREEPEDLKAALRGLVGAAFAMRQPVGKH